MKSLNDGRGRCPPTSTPHFKHGKTKTWSHICRAHLPLCNKHQPRLCVSHSESCPLSNTSFPHVLPLLSLLEKSIAVGEGTEPWETVEVGVDVVMFHLGAARTIAQVGGIYRSNVESKLQSKRVKTKF